MAYAATLKFDATRPPTRRDVIVFYGVLPLLYALWLTGMGIRFVSYLSFGNGLLYMSLHCVVAWWVADIGCRTARYLLRRWRLPLWGILIAGFLLTMVPMAYFYTAIADLLWRYYPSIAPFTSSREFEWSLDYLLHFVRYSVPWLATWILAVYGYRFFTGVSWYESPAESRQRRETCASEAGALPTPAANALPSFLEHSRLPTDANVFAINAAEHYIHVWSDQGTDMIRYRFRDALRDMAGVRGRQGIQVHRSWWIDPARITRCRTRGRSMHLTVAGELEVPVSVAHRKALQAAQSSVRGEH